MNIRLWVWGIAAAGLLLAAARSEEKKGTADTLGPDKPVAEHKDLARLAGEYNTVSKFRAKPEDSPVESSAPPRSPASWTGASSWRKTRARSSGSRARASD
jgi:hypothetical protein